MVSAERVLGYCKVPQEASLESEPGCKPEDDWPSRGGIEVRAVPIARAYITYILKGIHTYIHPKRGFGEWCWHPLHVFLSLCLPVC